MAGTGRVYSALVGTVGLGYTGRQAMTKILVDDGRFLRVVTELSSRVAALAMAYGYLRRGAVVVLRCKGRLDTVLRVVGGVLTCSYRETPNAVR